MRESVRMQTTWFKGELYTLSDNRVLFMLISKADSQDAFWDAIENFFRRITKWFRR